jgi:uncharacterized protein (DUF58 family)
MARPRYVPYTLRYWRYLWRYKLTPAGRFLFWSLGFTSAGLASIVIPVYQVFCVLLSVYLVVWFFNLLFRPKLSVSGELAQRVTAGEELRAEFELLNSSRRRPAFDLMLWIVGLPKSFRILSADQVIPQLGPGERGRLPLILHAERRGVFPMPELRPHTTFPFNLMRSGSTRHPLGTVTVLPAFHPIDSLDVPVGQKYQPGGVALSSHIGESPEYIGNREYVPGEPIRRMDFRGWARLGKPVVREFQEEYYCRIALILDTWIPIRRPSKNIVSPQLEAAISLSASIADALSATEHLIDIFAAGPELYVFRAGRQLAHFDNVLEILAAVDSCMKDPFAKVTPAVADELSSITTAICVFLDWDDSRANLARTIVEAGCQLKLIIVRDGETRRPIEDVGGDVTLLTPERIQQGGFDRL